MITLGLGLMVGLSLLAVGLRSLDHAGWLPHWQDTAVYAGPGDWPPGELRPCAALPKADGSIFFLGCGEAGSAAINAPIVPVTYWGRIQRPDRFTALRSVAMEGWNWQCKKDGDKYTCYAVN